MWPINRVILAQHGDSSSQSLSIKRQLGDRERIANSLGNLANVALAKVICRRGSPIRRVPEIMRELAIGLHCNHLDGLGRKPISMVTTPGRGSFPRRA